MVIKKILWTLVCLVSLLSIGYIAFLRGEPINSLWLLTGAVSTALVGYRFYGKFIADKVLDLRDTTDTPANRINDGKDFVPTSKVIVFGHHVAAIAGAGPLIGPVLAAQMGYLPGALWIIIGVVVAGAVQDFVILVASMRRNGKSLGQMARDEISPMAGLVALSAVLLITLIIIAVLGLVIVNALKSSPWGVATLAMTIPIAMLVGLYIRYIRPGRVFEASAIGVVLTLGAVVGGKYIAQSPELAALLTLSADKLCWALMIYGFFASILPVWILLAPRDYLSAFIKLGTICLVCAGVLMLHPTLQMPALTHFKGEGPIFAGNIFPFLFIVITCGAISGFHALIASGTTPKLLNNEIDARPIGYGAMCCESVVCIMAIIAACVISPGVYFAINSPASAVGKDPVQATAKISTWGYPVTAGEVDDLAKSCGEKTVMARTGGAPTFAIGIANIFTRTFNQTAPATDTTSGASAPGASAIPAASAPGATAPSNGLDMSFWYHFAIMFEALFVLTNLDAGTRVCRYILQDFLRLIWKPLGKTDSMPAVIFTSALVVSFWGYFLYWGVVDPFGGINSLLAIAGLANQLLSVVALAVCTTILIKTGKAKYAWVTLGPLSLLATASINAGYLKIFDSSPKMGFLALAKFLQSLIDGHKTELAGMTESIAQKLIFNSYLDAVLTSIFLVLVILLLVEAIRSWFRPTGATAAIDANVFGASGDAPAALSEARSADHGPDQSPPFIRCC